MTLKQQQRQTLLMMICNAVIRPETVQTWHSSWPSGCLMLTDAMVLVSVTAASTASATAEVDSSLCTYLNTATRVNSVIDAFEKGGIVFVWTKVEEKVSSPYF